ncbi:hypothetical protein EZS27_024240 [termite gut metagenome]|uniref:ATPase AAA-type core domain-containing protein n=1 Tax=termite gut metagenome TaxID=433724 RepID=A0A5J4R134_9ZZZZ
MTKFCIIALKTGSDGNSIRNFRRTSDEQTTVDIDYLKNLKNKIYCFNNHYSFSGKDDFSEIKYDEKDLELYSLTLSDGKTKILVNISAIVGGNGSGKSALIELLYWINYNLACQLELLEDDEEIKYKPNTLNLELLYSTDKGYRLLRVEEKESEFYLILNFLY